MTRQSRLTGRALGASALLCLSLALGAAIGPAAANKVGVAAAVNPDAFSSLSGAPKSQLNIGKSIFFNERIATTTSGLVQVLLVDGSTFTVGPDSDLVIDKFVYDPSKGTGQIAASFSKGVMRFVGGKISKSDNAVTINTPAGAMAVRGCIILTQVTPSSFAAVLVYGDYLKMANRTIFDNGTGFFISATGNTEVRKATSADIGGMTAALSNNNNNQNNNNGNDSSKMTTGTALQMVDTASLNELIQNANTQTVVADSTKVEVPAVPTIPEPEPEIEQVTARVLTPPGVYYLEDGTNISAPSDHGILGGGTYPEGATSPLADDFEWTFNVSEGRFTGTVEGLTDVDCPGETCEEPVTGTPPPATVNFPWFEPNQDTGPCVNGVCEVTDATLTQEGETEILTGTAVSKPGFFSYQLINTPAAGSEDDPEPVLLFGGEAYSLPTQGTGQLREFDLTADAAASGAAGPFMSTESSPVLSEDSPSATVTPLMMLDKDPDPVEGQNPSRRVWLQSSFSMEGSGSDQQSSVNVALGEWDPEAGLTGARRGGSHVFQPCEGECASATTRESNAFTGDIASLEGPDGAHFMGEDNPNIVVGLDSTGSHDIGRDAPLDPNSTPIQEQVGATYHVGVGGDPTTPTQTLQGVKQGYAAGIVESKAYPGSEPGSGVQFANVVASKSSDDMGVSFDPAANTLAADITVYDVQNHDGATSQYQLHFGDSEGSSGRSSYIDDGNYAAIERATVIDPETGLVHTPAQVFNGSGTPYEQSDATSYFVNGDQLGVTKYFPETFGEADASGNPPPFCTDCEFIEWGAWGSRVEFGNDAQNPYVDDVHLGWWVAGDITSPADIDALAALGATATYSGNVIGDVAYNPDGTGWTTYTATGKMEMDWNFSQRQGNLTISRFDTSVTPGGLTFSGPMCAPGEGCATRPGNHFGGPLNTVQPVGNGAQLPSNLANISGSATGSFVNDGPDKPAAGAIGNWNVSNSMHGQGGYKATGVFAGRRN